MESKEKRRFIRTFVFVPATFTFSRLESGKAGIIDVSLSGLRMTTDRELKTGQALNLEFVIPGHGTVRTVGIVKHRTGIFYGIKFREKDIRRLLKSRLEDFIVRHRTEQDLWLRKKVSDIKNLKLVK